MKSVTVEGIAKEEESASEEIMLDSLLENAKESLELPVTYVGEAAPQRFKVTITVEELK